MKELAILKQKLEKILVNYPKLFLHLINNLQLKYELSMFSKCLATFFIQKNLHQVWLYCFNECIKKAVFPTDVLSRESILFCVLADVLNFLNIHDMNYSTIYRKVELSDLQGLPDDLKSKLNIELELNEPSTRGTFAVIINRVCNSLRFSRRLSLIFRKWSKMLQTKFNLDATHKIISHFVSDFLLIPPLLMPSIWSLKRDIPLKTGEILFLKKVLLHLSDQVPFKKPEHLEYNCLIDAFQIPFRMFIISLCTMKLQVVTTLNLRGAKNSSESLLTPNAEFNAENGKTNRSSTLIGTEPDIRRIVNTVTINYELHLSFEYVIYYLLEIRPLIYQYCLSLKNVPLSRSKFFWNLLNVLEKIDAILSPNLEMAYRSLNNVRLLVNSKNNSNNIMRLFIPPELTYRVSEKEIKSIKFGKIGSDTFKHPRCLNKSVSGSQLSIPQLSQFKYQLETFHRPPSIEQKEKGYFSVVGNRDSFSNESDNSISTSQNLSNDLLLLQSTSNPAELEDPYLLKNVATTAELAHVKHILSIIQKTEYGFMNTDDEKLWKLSKQLKQVKPSDKTSILTLLQEQNAIYRKKVGDLTDMNVYLLNKLSSLDPRIQKINYFTERLTNSIHYRIQKNTYLRRLFAYMKGAYRYSVDDSMLGLKNLYYQDRIVLIWSSVLKRLKK
ncbi:uncharacterized protein LOC126315423 [Schistocerca gregaria]|uniref:uncharacterized protein LOC126315423 n=1 Tax=Schistocerca gregaria TaxID=7010 RepID=UPI00211F0FAB|nr:uncharacterized protein LOC126315423 [Schistocerca gregaria]